MATCVAPGAGGPPFFCVRVALIVEQRSRRPYVIAVEAPDSSP
jgi:hypothetical protein